MEKSGPNFTNFAKLGLKRKDLDKDE